MYRLSKNSFIRIAAANRFKIFTDSNTTSGVKLLLHDSMQLGRVQQILEIIDWIERNIICSKRSCLNQENLPYLVSKVQSKIGLLCDGVLKKFLHYCSCEYPYSRCDDIVDMFAGLIWTFCVLNSDLKSMLTFFFQIYNGSTSKYMEESSVLELITDILRIDASLSQADVLVCMTSYSFKA